MAAQDFAQAWREHSALSRQCRNVQDKVLGVTQCVRLGESGEKSGLRGASAGYEGVICCDCSDLDVASDIWNDPETLAIMRPDEPRVFSTFLRDFTLVCRERVLLAAPASGVALFGFLRRSASISRVRFDAACANGPADAWLAAPALQRALRVVHNSVVQTPPEGYDYVGIAERWFDSAEAARAAFGASDLRCQLPAASGQRPAASGAIADLERSVFMFPQVRHRRP